MFIEKRKVGDSVKFYLVHSYRNETGEVRKLRRFLGTNLTKKELEESRKNAEKKMKETIKDLGIDVFTFSLSPKELESLNKYNDKLTIHHLNAKDWQRFVETFVYNTNAIEGSTILQEEVQEILEKEETKDPEEIETQGVAKAVHYIRAYNGEITKTFIAKLHQLCFEGSKSFAGKYRTVEVVIKSRDGNIIHSGVPANKVDSYIKELAQWYASHESKFKPLVLAAIIHNQFEFIHPFQDGNGRVGRLLLNFILIKNNYPPIDILLEDRAEYYYTLHEYSKNHNLKPTMRFLIKQYKKTINQVTTKK